MTIGQRNITCELILGSAATRQTLGPPPGRAVFKEQRQGPATPLDMCRYGE